MTTEERKKYNREFSRKWNKEHPKEHLEHNRKYREDNPESMRRSRRNWRKKNKERDNLNAQRRKARKLKSEGDFTLEEWLVIKEKHNNCCVCCGLSEEILNRLGFSLVPDHIIPLATSGKNDISNIQPLCHTNKKGLKGGCNNRKNSKTAKDYRKSFRRNARKRT